MLPTEVLTESPLACAMVGTVSIGAGALAWRQVRTIVSQAREEAGRYEVLDDADLAQARRMAGSAWIRFDKLLALVRHDTALVVRRGHMSWINERLNVPGDPGVPPPHLVPPAGRPYSILEDAGLPAFRRSMVARADGHMVAAVEHLRTGAALGSPLCTARLAIARIRGEVPGHGPDPSAAETLEAAAAAGFGSIEHASFLLNGVFLHRDIPRAISLLEGMLQGEGGAGAALILATLFAEGLLVAKDLDRAADYLLMNGPSWRRLAARCGLSQATWACAELDARSKALQAAAVLTGAQRQRIAQHLVRGLKGS